MVKSALRSFVIHFSALWLVAENVGGLAFNNDLKILALAAIALSLVDFFIKPILNLLLLPFNLITLGLFRWIVNVFTLYITTLLVQDFAVVAFKFPGLATSGLIIPPAEFSSFAAYIVVSFLTSAIASFLFWIVR